LADAFEQIASNTAVVNRIRIIRAILRTCLLVMADGNSDQYIDCRGEANGFFRG
jgi:hypothetical protein